MSFYGTVKEITEQMKEVHGEDTVVVIPILYTEEDVNATIETYRESEPDYFSCMTEKDNEELLDNMMYSLTHHNESAHIACGLTLDITIEDYFRERKKDK